MILSKKLSTLYDNIKLYDRYSNLSNTYCDYESSLQIQDKKNVLEIFEELGYSAKYKTNEKFYAFYQNIENNSFYFHLGLRFGIVEIIFGLKKDVDSEHIGGAITGICKRIELSNNIHKEEYIKGPAFSSYEELKEILNILLLLFEDFKKEFLDLYST